MKNRKAAGRMGAILLSAAILGPYGEACAAEDKMPRSSYSSMVETKATRMRSPEGFGRLVEKHVQRMYKEDYFWELCPEDLDHGHVLVPGGGMVYRSMEDFLSKTGIILYHTDESTTRWNAFNLPPEKRPQRSVLGHMNGRISAAKGMIMKQRLANLRDYPTHGTVHSSDLAKENPEYRNSLNDFYIITGSTPCRATNQFQIVPEEAGRFSFPRGSFEVYMVCY